jgi:hypothetical protein
MYSVHSRENSPYTMENHKIRIEQCEAAKNIRETRLCPSQQAIP